MVLFNFWHSRLLWIYLQITWNFSWKFSHTTLSKYNEKQNCFQIKNRLQTGIVISRNNKTIREYKKYVDKDKGGEDVPKLESDEVVLVHCNLVNNSYQQASKVLFTFVPNKQFGQLITISPHLLTMLKTINAEFQSIQLWFTDQNNRPLEIEDSVNITLIIGQTL